MQNTTAFELAPGDVGAFFRPVPGLVRGAGPGRFTAELPISLHHPARHASLRFLQPHVGTAREVERPDIQRCADADARFPLDEFFGKQCARVPVIKRSVDMRRPDRDEAGRAEKFSRLGNNAHGHGRAFAITPAGDCLFVSGEFQAQASSFRMVTEVARS